MLTVDANNSVQQALAIHDGKGQAIGSDADIIALAGPDTTTLDLRGRTVILGIIDIHAHMAQEGLKGIFPSLEGLRSIGNILAVIQRLVVEKQSGEWVVTIPIGDPPNFANMPGKLKQGRYPTQWELDQVSPNNPVYIRGIWPPWNVTSSVSIANSLPPESAGIDRSTSAPHSTVTIDHDASGEPTGIFIDANRFPTVEFTLMKVVPRLTQAQRVQALKEPMSLYGSVGTTGTYEGHGVAPEVLDAYKEVRDAGDMIVWACLTLSPKWRLVNQAEREMARWTHSASGPGCADDMLNTS